MTAFDMTVLNDMDRFHLVGDIRQPPIMPESHAAGQAALQSVVAAHTSEVWVGRPSPEVKFKHRRRHYAGIAA